MKQLIFATLLTSSLAQAEMSITGVEAKNLWNAIDAIGKIEDTGVISERDGHQLINIDTVSCVFEMYNACSFFSTTDSGRNFIIATDGSEKFMQTLAKAGIAVNEEDARMDVVQIFCEHESNNYVCRLTEFIRPTDQ